MLKKILPVVLLLVGSGAGVGAGMFLRPATEVSMPHDEGEGESGAGKDNGAENEHAAEKGHEVSGNQPKDDGHGGGSHGSAEAEYVKLNNQFVVPIVQDGAVKAMVVLSLSLEVPGGAKEAVFRREPKLRDSFLQVLFDHANVGGFDGAFTEANNLAVLRRSLLEAAQKDMDADTIRDVLILEIARQDY